MRLLVLAGGFGTRLHSVVGDVPKALAPVGLLPFLYLQIDNWIAQGIRSFVFLLHHQAGAVIQFLTDAKRDLLKDCEIVWVVEPAPMDTGGAVAYAVQELRLSGNFLLTNADTWLTAGIQNVMKCDAPAMAVVRLSDASRYGLVQFDNQLRVTAFREKENFRASGWINAGLCHLNVSAFMNWNGEPFSMERVTFSELASCGQLKAVILDTDFIDIGIPNDYRRFCLWIESGRKGKLCN